MTMQWDPALYDGSHRFVTEYGGDLVTLLAPQPGERILDVGCGTGHLTEQIAAAGAAAVGLDRSAEMITAARRAHPDVEFLEADIIDFRTDRPFDAVFSNAALHWVRPPERGVAAMSAALRLGGRFVVEFGGRGNVQRIDAALTHGLRELAGVELEAPNYFPSVAEYAGLLEQHGIEVVLAQLFDRWTKLEAGAAGLANWLQMFRRPQLELCPPYSQLRLIALVEDLARPQLHRENTWHADYRRLRIVGRKE